MSLQLPLFEREHYGDVQVRFGSLPLYFGPTRSVSRFYRGKGRLIFSSFFLTVFVCSLPAIALFLSVVISLYTDFFEATKTHCGVYNFLPSISTAISFPWTSPIWTALIYFHAPPRFLAYAVYRRWLPNGFWTRVCLSLYFIEILSLISLTHYDSDSAHKKHVFSFTCFGIFSILHMILHSRITAPLSSRVSARLKRRSLVVALGCICACGMLFVRHNSHCEPYVFSIFAGFEYTFVLANIVFHSSFRHDFPDYALYAF